MVLNLFRVYTMNSCGRAVCARTATSRTQGPGRTHSPPRHVCEPAKVKLWRVSADTVASQSTCSLTPANVGTKRLAAHMSEHAVFATRYALTAHKLVHAVFSRTSRMFVLFYVHLEPI